MQSLIVVISLSDSRDQLIPTWRCPSASTSHQLHPSPRAVWNAFSHHWHPNEDKFRLLCFDLLHCTPHPCSTNQSRQSGTCVTQTRSVSSFPTNQIDRYEKIPTLNTRCIRSWHPSLQLGHEHDTLRRSRDSSPIATQHSSEKPLETNFTPIWMFRSPA
jgi:hypothetical protein